MHPTLPNSLEAYVELEGGPCEGQLLVAAAGSPELSPLGEASNGAPAMEQCGDVPPPSPFERVPAPLRSALERRGFVELTSVQVGVLEASAHGRDLQVSSQTGSGKTVAIGFVLAPGLALRLAGEVESRAERRGPSVLLVVPTRELAMQVCEELEWLYAELPGATVDCVTGGTSVSGERRRLGRRPRIVVGTPGRLLDHIRSGALDCSGIAELVLDEADRMLELGFREELEGILDATPAERRTHLVSATFPPAIQRLAARYQAHPLHVEGTRLGAANEDIEHVVHLIRDEDRYAALVNLLLLAEGERTLVFVDTRAETTLVSAKLAEDGFSVLPLSGELQQEGRTRTLDAFRAGTVTTLVATDVAARGLDVENVSMVVHAGRPKDAEVYTHRSGRTGRAGRKGRSVLVAPASVERWVRRMLSTARVAARWIDVPTAEVVRSTLARRERARLDEALQSAEGPSEALLEHARSLLRDHAPEHVVATLLERARARRVREPFAIEPPESRRNGSREPFALRAPRERRPGSPRPGRARGDFTPFTINWGFRKGASPQRLLALVCRRGGISGRFVGAIDVGPHASTFEVASPVAPAFESKARNPDARDPNLVIEVSRRN